ncbi:hypothetical protein WJX73_003840 [Symbiochloris irregularis]|uniref:Uncharacterized protein n=1 Tax=Symbiochloris irregularis TaxID=706552 RepID=A0AAW1PG38_9CHLO
MPAVQLVNCSGFSRCASRRFNRSGSSLGERGVLVSGLSGVSVPATALVRGRFEGRGRQQAVHVLCYRPSPQPVSDYHRAAPLTAWSPIRSVFSLGKFFFITGTATTTAWFAHPQLLNIAAHVLHLDFKDSVTAFQTSFFSFLSLVFAIYSGNTMAFLYDRQKEMVKMLYAETMALEELLEEAVNTLGPDARDILAQIRLYIDEEIFAPENQTPPLGDGCALSAIRSKARNYRRAGTDVGDILHASQRLAHAQSERQATACRLLPPVHWALLYTIGMLFVSTFILFETGGSFSNEGRHILFTVLCGLMSFVLCALRDLADPAEGVYNATALLGDRLLYIQSMLDKYQKIPTRTNTSPMALVTGQASSSSSNGKGSSKPETERSLVLSELQTARNTDNGQPEVVSASVLASRKLAGNSLAQPSQMSMQQQQPPHNQRHPHPHNQQSSSSSSANGKSSTGPVSGGFKES